MAIRRGVGAAGAGALALRLHQRLEALVVDRETLLGEQLLRQVVGEAVGVVQAEGVLGVDPGRALRLRVGDQLGEQLGAAVERAPEALLLVVDPPHHGVALGNQVRIGAAHQLDHALGKAAEPRRLEPEHPALLDRAAHDPPQHVAALLVRRHDSVGDQVDGAAGVIGDDPHRAGHALVAAVLDP